MIIVYLNERIRINIIILFVLWYNKLNKLLSIKTSIFYYIIYYIIIKPNNNNINNLSVLCKTHTSSIYDIKTLTSIFGKTNSFNKTFYLK